jgi:hypothetical protein
VPGLIRIISKVVAVQLDNVEGVEKHPLVGTVVVDELDERMPLSSQATASPSIMQKRERSQSVRSTALPTAGRTYTADARCPPRLSFRGKKDPRAGLRPGHCS